ncbi:YmfQ family protein [Rouxiella badensis]|uniref:YmfQ family protein n=1 Tax=Rouxiella badensis TaxID=1646377 RepID=UPI001D13B680|nr:YmfQ family protein [Rouxiella badensis]MCC3745334.1 YmfQ family protein [Rouxiella badensis]
MSRFSADDYSQALQALMPTGEVWPRSSNSVQAAVIRALSQSFQRSDDDATLMLKGAFPSTATMMLTDWENTLGLPDDCAIGELDSIPLRQKAVVAKLFSTGSQSIPYFIGVAKALGYSIAIATYRQARAGMSVCGDSLNGDDWPFVWTVQSEDTNYSYAQAGVSYCGDPLRSWGNKRLECTLNNISPSHTLIIFEYVVFNFEDEGVYDMTSDFAQILDAALTYI